MSDCFAYVKNKRFEEETGFGVSSGLNTRKYGETSLCWVILTLEIK